MRADTGERQLVLEARQGDEAAFEELVCRHEKKVYNLALRMTGSRDDACELTQDAFLNAYRNLASFKMECSFGTWLYRLTSNACIDFLRREKRRRTISMTCSIDEEEAERQSEIPDLRYSPEAELERRELRRSIASALDSLSPEHRQILILREIDDLSYAEIAAALELEEGTVKSRISRARLQLRRVLTAEGNFFSAEASKESTGGELHERV